MAAHRGIITWFYAQYSYDYRRIVLLNPPVLCVKNVCVWVGVHLCGRIQMCQGQQSYDTVLHTCTVSCLTSTVQCIMLQLVDVC